MDNLGWTPMITLRDDVYPNLVAHFYANASKEYGNESIDSYVKGVNITLSRDAIRKIWGMGHGGEKYKKDVKREEQLEIILGQDVNECVQPKANAMSLELRLVHYFVCTILIPKTEKYEHVSNREFFLGSYMTDFRIDLSMFILDQMYKATMNKISLPYGMVLTKVFKYFKVDLSDEIS